MAVLCSVLFCFVHALFQLWRFRRCWTLWFDGAFLYCTLDCCVGLRTYQLGYEQGYKTPTRVLKALLVLSPRLPYYLSTIIYIYICPKPYSNHSCSYEVLGPEHPKPESVATLAPWASYGALKTGAGFCGMIQQRN